MAQLLRMPEIAANMVEAVLNDWPVAENAAFRAGDAIATVETDKAVVDVPAEADGVLLRTLVEPGKAVTVGTPMAVLASPGETVDDVDALVARLTGGEAPGVAHETSPAGAREVSQGGAEAVVEERHGTGAAGAGPAGASGRVFASPLARRIARENGLAVADIPGTGPGGRIVRDDVRRALADRTTAVHGRTGTDAATAAARPSQTSVPFPPHGRAPTSGLAAGVPQPAWTIEAAAAAEAPAAATPRTPSVPGTAATGGSRTYTDIPHSRMRRAIATRLAQSIREAPVFTVRGSARVDALLTLRHDLNEATGVRISVNDLIVAAAARAHLTVPEMNVIWTPDAVRRFDDVDIAVAVATDTGLVTPVLRGVQRLTVSALARASADVVARARDGELRQDELEGGTLTVTNLGVFGAEDFTAVINPPQAAILAVGAAREEAVVTQGELGVATVLRVTLSVDHRPVDGATAARWMAAFLALLEAPLRILA